MRKSLIILTVALLCNVAAADGGAGVVVARRAEYCRIRRDAASEGREQRDEVMRALEVGRR